MDEARGSVDRIAQDRDDAQATMDRFGGMSAEDMREYNRLVGVYQDETTRRQELNAEYRSSTNQNMSAVDKSMTGRTSGPGQRRTSAGEGITDRYGFGTLNNISRSGG